jgi:hypothetical protein
MSGALCIARRVRETFDFIRSPKGSRQAESQAATQAASQAVMAGFRSTSRFVIT